MSAKPKDKALPVFCRGFLAVVNVGAYSNLLLNCYIRKKTYLCKVSNAYNKMKILKIVISFLFVMLVNVQFAGAQNKKTVYIFGLGDSMRDSIVYTTAVQRIDMANVQKRTDFLLDRADYSQQLKDYFSQRLNDRTRVCVLYVCKSEKAAYKKLYKVRSNYLDEGAIVKQIETSDFAFVPIEGVIDNSEEVKNTLNGLE